MPRLCIFAHYDPQNIIDDYVIYYLEQLKKVADRIIFVSDGDVSEKELLKINHLIFDSVCKRHGESNDFGSYKRGFQLLTTKHQNEFNQLDELLFVNDSCYCLGSFEKIFEDMEKVDCDMWGMVDDYDNNISNRFVSYHKQRHYLQSWFLVFRKSVFVEDFFKKFLLQVTGLPSKNDIVENYEIGLSQLILQNKRTIYGYFNRNRIAAYIKNNHESLSAEIIEITKPKYGNIAINQFKETWIGKNLFNLNSFDFLNSEKFYVLFKLHSPFLKRLLIRNNSHIEINLVYFWKEIIDKLFGKFDSEIITNYSKRIGIKTKQPSNLPSNPKRHLVDFNRIKKRFLSEFLFQIKITKNNNLIVKILKIPVFNKNFFRKILFIKEKSSNHSSSNSL